MRFVLPLPGGEIHVGLESYTPCRQLRQPIVEYLDETQHHQTLIWQCLKRNGINVYEYLRKTGIGCDIEVNNPSSVQPGNPHRQYLAYDS